MRQVKTKHHLWLLSRRNHAEVTQGLSGLVYSLHIESSIERISSKLSRLPCDLLLINLPLKEVTKEMFVEFRECLGHKKIPIIVISSPEDFSLFVHVVNRYADDYIVSPVRAVELRARIEKILKTKNISARSLHSLTHLPNRLWTRDMIEDIIRRNILFATAWIDINGLETYNELFGYLQGDDVLRGLARIIKNTFAKCDRTKSSFCGHLGSDNFVVIDDVNRMDTICQNILREFEIFKTSLYSQKDLEHQYVISKDRKGELTLGPLMSLSIAIVTNEKRQIYHFGQINMIARQMHKFLLTRSGSHMIKDRRMDFLGSSMNSRRHHSIPIS